MDEQQVAIEYLVNNSLLGEKAATFAIEWIADDPMPWAKMYAPYVDQIPESEVEEYATEYPYDVIFEDAQMDGVALVIAESPALYF